MRHAATILALALFAASCETTPIGSAPSHADNAALDLGDWRHETPEAELSYFQGVIASRYAMGAALSAATADLRSNDFSCAPDNDTTGRGDPPAQICRKTMTAENCTATWQVHLFDTHGDGHIARSRALYDRRCGNEGLLGGPG